MGAWGAIIMGFFGAVFGALTLYWQWHVSSAWLALPFVVTVVIAVAGVRVIRQPGAAIALSDRVRHTIMWSSTAEGIGMFLAANIVINLHRPDLLLPAMALVVGLHFLPIAGAAALRPFFLLGAALIVTSVVGFVLPAPLGGSVAGAMAAASLWIAAALALRRDVQAKRGGGVRAAEMLV